MSLEALLWSAPKVVRCIQLREESVASRGATGPLAPGPEDGSASQTAGDDRAHSTDVDTDLLIRGLKGGSAS